MDVLRIRINQATMNHIKKLAESKGVTTSGMARDLLEQALSRRDSSAAIADLGRQASEALRQLTEIRSILTEKKNLSGQSESIQQPAKSIHEYKARKGIQ